MIQKTVLIIGSGHLAYRLKRFLQQQDYFVSHTTIEQISATEEYNSLLENLDAYLKDIDTEKLSMVYLVDEKDEDNLQLIIAFISLNKTTPITASLFNENLIPHLHAEHERLTILNPAKIAAPYFVAPVYNLVDLELNYVPVRKKIIDRSKFKLSLIQKLLISFAGLIAISVVFFHYYENLSWIDSLYFVVVTAGAVGYGDISVLYSPNASKIFTIMLILSSTVFIWMIFSLTIDAFLKKNIQLELGRKKYHFTDHIIVCGLGRLGYFIVEELLNRQEKVIIIEMDETSNHIDYFRQAGAEVYIGDAKLTKVLSDVNVKKARALISVVRNDFINVEVGLNARTINPDLNLIMRIFDEKMAEKIKENLNIHHTLSASAISDEKFYEILRTKM